MTKRSMALLALLASLVFVTCTGCAGIYISPSGHVVGLAIGEAEATQKQAVDIANLCSGTNYHEARGQESYRPQVVEVTNPAFQVVPVSPIPRCDATQVAMKEVSVKGGKLGSGWFGVLTTFFLTYFSGGTIAGVL